MGAARAHARAEAKVFGGAGVFRLTVGFLADEDRRFLIDAVAQRVFTGDAVVVGIHRRHDAVLGLVGYREVVNGQVNVRVGAGLDAGWQQRGDLVGVGAVDNFQHRPVDDIARIALGLVAHRCFSTVMVGMSV